MRLAELDSEVKEFEEWELKEFVLLLGWHHLKIRDMDTFTASSKIWEESVGKAFAFISKSMMEVKLKDLHLVTKHLCASS